jgi:hypothetical protein
MGNSQWNDLIQKDKIVSGKRWIWWDRCCGLFVSGWHDGKIGKHWLEYRRGNCWWNNMIQSVGMIRKMGGDDYIMMVVCLLMVDLMWLIKQVEIVLVTIHEYQIHKYK